MSYYLTLALTLFLYMSACFVISLIRKRNDIADVAWGLGFVIMAWLSYYLSNSNDMRQLIICTLVSIWGLRLAWHIYIRNRGKGEDYRYIAWRKEWGKWFYIRSYLQVYILQGILLFLVVMPVLLINNYSSSDIGVLDILGIAIWMIGFYFESVGDAQLARFISDSANKGKIMQSGLWAYSRHPNYFGEVTQWWSIWIIALSVSYGYWGIIGPLTITFLILKVSGVPLLEQKMAENPDFAKYKSEVSMFIPMPRR